MKYGLQTLLTIYYSGVKYKMAISFFKGRIFVQHLSHYSAHFRSRVISELECLGSDRQTMK